MPVAVRDLSRHDARVGAVVVSYRPDLAVLDTLLEALSKQVNIVYVVDNGSGEGTLEGLRALIAGKNIEIIALPTNRGIATAHNVGIGRVVERGLKYVLLFDQDSVPAPDMVARLVSAHQSLDDQGTKVAAVGPVSVDQRTGTLGNFVRIRAASVRQVPCAGADDVMEVDFLISSGCLIPVGALNAIGGMNDDYFIDHVDTEWCLRARAAGWQLFGVCGAKLSHALGDRVVRVWLGRWREVSVHSPLRDYYMFRNTVLMLKHVPMAWSWRIAHLRRIALFFVFFGIVIAPRRERVAMMVRGIWHGIVGRAGSY
ncbi:glycosyltransferase family 2 protein [Ralstonia sp. R-29]|uniref:glycosyltransferase family 2 protein n=1 Tax=Ralstonia sp. R-29 TaxID=3404059 RepID=UPI003CE8B224